MKTFDFFDKDGDLVERKRCSQIEARIYAKNFGFKFEEHKRGKNEEERKM